MEASEAPRFVIAHLAPATADDRRPLQRMLGERAPLSGCSGGEYSDSEEFQLVHRDRTAPPDLTDDVTTPSELRRNQGALPLVDGAAFHDAGNDGLPWYSKRGADGGVTPSIVVDLDPHSAQESMAHVPLELLGLVTGPPFAIEDVLGRNGDTWEDPRAYVRLDPAVRVGRILGLVSGA